MRKMTKVVRYRCKWCGGEFHTPNLHVCKWDPDCKNCLSCVHRGKFIEGEPTRQIGFGEWEEGTDSGFECHINGETFTPEGGWNAFPQAATAQPQYRADGSELRCPDYKLIEGYEGKETFKEIEEKRRQESCRKK